MRYSFCRNTVLSQVRRWQAREKVELKVVKVNFLVDSGSLKMNFYGEDCDGENRIWSITDLNKGCNYELMEMMLEQVSSSESFLGKILYLECKDGSSLEDGKVSFENDEGERVVLDISQLKERLYAKFAGRQFAAMKCGFK